MKYEALGSVYTNIEDSHTCKIGLKAPISFDNSAKFLNLREKLTEQKNLRFLIA